MSEKLTVYGFDESTYVRTVRMVLAEKGAEYDLVPVDIMVGENKQPEHLARHPFAKIPVVEHGGKRLYETGAITRYLNDVLPGKSLVPDTAMGRARMDMALCIHDSSGYGALIGLAAPINASWRELAQKTPECRDGELGCSPATKRAIRSRSSSRPARPRSARVMIAAAAPSQADFLLAPVCCYVDMTEDKDAAFDVPGFADWWARVQGLDAYTSTAPSSG